MIKFVNGDTNGRTPKRQQTSRACSPCRRKKKRCRHHSPSPETMSQTPRSQEPMTQAASSRLSILSEASARAGRHSDGTRGNMSPPSSTATPLTLPSIQHVLQAENSTPTQLKSNSTHIRDESLGARFIGDLVPESVFLAASSPDATRGSSMEGSVGVWLRSTLNKKIAQPGNSNPLELPSSSLFFGSKSLVSEALLPLLQQECLSTLPPPQHLEALTKLYFERIHPIFPVIDMEEFQVSPATNCSVLLQQAICLATSKNFAAAPHLHLPDTQGPMDPIDFHDRITRAMRLSMEMSLVTDKLVLIQACALMSQWMDFPEGGELNSMLCAKAVHHVHTIGLHVKIQQGLAREKYGSTLLCCVFVIDRMNAIFNGRPVLMHDEDNRSDMRDSFNDQAPAFRLYLRIVLLLETIMPFYRPGAVAGVEYIEHYPSFEDLVVECEADSIGTWALASLEILYQVVTILSYRSKTLTDTQRSSPSYVRQMHSMSTLTATILPELRDLTMFPFVPYGLSLALTIAYREMRYGKIPLHRSRSRAQFQTISDALVKLSSRFRCAARLAEMGQRLTNEMDRVISTVSKSKPLNQVQASTNTGDELRGQLPTSVPAASMSNNVSDSNSADLLGPAYEFNPEMFDPTADIDLFGMFDPAFNLETYDTQWDPIANPTFATQP